MFEKNKIQNRAIKFNLIKDLDWAQFFAKQKAHKQKGAEITTKGQGNCQPAPEGSPKERGHNFISHILGKKAAHPEGGFAKQNPDFVQNPVTLYETIQVATPIFNAIGGVFVPLGQAGQPKRRKKHSMGFLASKKPIKRLNLTYTCPKGQKKGLLSPFLGEKQKAHLIREASIQLKAYLTPKLKTIGGLFESIYTKERVLPQGRVLFKNPEGTNKIFKKSNLLQSKSGLKQLLNSKTLYYKGFTNPPLNAIPFAEHTPLPSSKSPKREKNKVADQGAFGFAPLRGFSAGFAEQTPQKPQGNQMPHKNREQDYLITLRCYKSLDEGKQPLLLDIQSKLSKLIFNQPYPFTTQSFKNLKNQLASYKTYKASFKTQYERDKLDSLLFRKAIVDSLSTIQAKRSLYKHLLIFREDFREWLYDEALSRGIEGHFLTLQNGNNSRGFCSAKTLNNISLNYTALIRQVLMAHFNLGKLLPPQPKGFLRPLGGFATQSQNPLWVGHGYYKPIVTSSNSLKRIWRAIWANKDKPLCGPLLKARVRNLTILPELINHSSRPNIQSSVVGGLLEPPRGRFPPYPNGEAEKNLLTKEQKAYLFCPQAKNTRDLEEAPKRLSISRNTKGTAAFPSPILGGGLFCFPTGVSCLASKKPQTLRKNPFEAQKPQTQPKFVPGFLRKPTRPCTKLNLLTTKAKFANLYQGVQLKISGRLRGVQRAKKLQYNFGRISAQTARSYLLSNKTQIFTKWGTYGSTVFISRSS